MKTWVWILIIFILILIGIFTYSNNCKNRAECTSCRIKIFWINVYQEWAFCAQSGLTVGCGDANPQNWTKCCQNLADEKNIPHAQCVGNWIVENNTCIWKC